MSNRPLRVTVLVGSLRRDSVNRRLAELAVAHAPEGVSVQIVDDLHLLPFYNEDIDVDDQRGAAVEVLRAAVGASDALLVVTPEYNGGSPAVLRNAIDWLSRPYGAGALGGLPVGVIGAALGRYAGTWARDDVRKAAGIAGAEVIEEIDLGLPTAGLEGDWTRAPELVEQVTAALGRLTSAVGVSA